MLRSLWVVGLALGLLVPAGLWIAARMVGPRTDPGIRAGRLAPCPATPNCVSSQADPADTVHYVAPLRYTGSGPAARARLLELLQGEPRVRVAEAGPEYIRAEFRSRWFGFVDDVEFLVDQSRRLIHVRSASRLGYGDFGVNRRRIEHIRHRFSRPGPGRG